jgi:hypothetical protein
MIMKLNSTQTEQALSQFGLLPRGIGVERLRDAPAEWSLQYEALGLNPQQSNRRRASAKET